MIWARLFLIVEGILFALAGAWSVLGPFEGGNDAGLVFVSPAARVDSMAIQGGLRLGFGAFLVWSAVRKAYLPAGLLAIVFGALATGLARALGVAALGPFGPVEATSLVYDFGSALLAGLFLRSVLRDARLG